MSTKSERRAARQIVAVYHEEQLSELIHRVQQAMGRFQAGEIDAFGMDEVIFQFTARAVLEERPGNWWDRGAPRRR